MSEKRFILSVNEDAPDTLDIIDIVADKTYNFVNDVVSINQAKQLVDLLNELETKCSQLEKDNEKLQELVDVSMKADEVFSVFDDLKYIESALTFLIDNGLEDQCVECEREDIHFVAERLRIVLRSLDDE